MRRRYPNPRLAKSLLCYDVATIARLYGCHRNTVRNWFKHGLTPIDERRPVLVRGDALNAFHAARRASAKRPCGSGELYCIGCRKPQRPAGDMADYTPLNDKIGTVSAICPDCDRIMSQRVNAERLALFRERIAVTDRKP